MRTISSDISESLRVRRELFRHAWQNTRSSLLILESSRVEQFSENAISFSFSSLPPFVYFVRAKDSRWRRGPRGLISRNWNFCSSPFEFHRWANVVSLFHCQREFRCNVFTFVASSVNDTREFPREERGRRSPREQDFRALLIFPLPLLVSLLSLTYLCSFTKEFHARALTSARTKCTR